MKILIKAVMPHRQKILTQDGQEMRLQQWANKQAASSLRDAGGDAQGEQFSQSRDMLMRDAVENPEKYGLKFMGERLPFEGQNLESSLSEPDYSGEAEADFALRQEELEQAMKEGTMPNESQEDIDADKKRMENTVKLINAKRGSNLFDDMGRLRDDIPDDPKVDDGDPKVQRWQAGKSPEEEFNPDDEAEHMRRIMTSRQVPMRDAWSVLKQEPYNQKMCEECGVKPATHYYWGTSGCQECMGPNATPM
tara:strand:- start:446 stop:1195 length:750 start_codon:yes stop_codon:yes gene_type:complete